MSLLWDQLVWLAIPRRGDGERGTIRAGRALLAATGCLGGVRGTVQVKIVYSNEDEKEPGGTHHSNSVL
jgi:hypothetical protein